MPSKVPLSLFLQLPSAENDNDWLDRMPLVLVARSCPAVHQFQILSEGAIGCSAKMWRLEIKKEMHCSCNVLSMSSAVASLLFHQTVTVQPVTADICCHE